MGLLQTKPICLLPSNSKICPQISAIDLNPSLSNTNWRSLQVKHFATLRFPAGNTRMAPINHMHAETKILRVKEHQELMSKQFLLGSFLPNRADQFTTAKRFNVIFVHILSLWGKRSGQVHSREQNYHEFAQERPLPTPQKSS